MPRQRILSDAEWRKLPLGILADTEIAADLNARGIKCSRETVATHRKRLIRRETTPRDRINYDAIPAEEQGLVRAAIDAVAAEHHCTPAIVESLVCGGARSAAWDSETIAEARAIAYLLIYQLITADDQTARRLLRRTGGRWSLEDLAAEASQSCWLRARAMAIAARHGLPIGSVAAVPVELPQPEEDEAIPLP